MFGYHDSDRCMFDLWSPVDDPNHCAIENRAFSAYAKHTQELEDIIDTCVENYYNGNTNFTIDLDDDFSDAELEYIQEKVRERCL